MLLVIGNPLAGRAETQTGTDQPLSAEQLEQLVAPIALHPDSLLSQILMASTYPLEVVQAARWAKENASVTGKALEDAMAKQPWDPSVKSLTAFPQALQMLSDELSWTQQLGDAFLAQQEDVLDAVQRLRARADKSGNLKTTKQQKVEKQTVAVASGKQETVIVIEQADPKVVYVPAYNPTVVYGGWPYPAYPPYYWYPPGYVASRAFWFGAGVVVGRALWGRCDWGRRNVNINVNRYNSFNRSKITNANWTHNRVHRKGVPYRNRDVAARYGKGAGNVRSREQFRGRAQAGRRELSATRPGGGRPAVGNRPGGNKRPVAGKRPGAGQRPAAKRPAAKRPAAKRPAAKRPGKVAARPATPRRPTAAKRPSTRRPQQARRPAAYQGMGRGSQVRRQSARGQQSRQVMRSRGGGGRGGGGGGRRGGGRRR
ncbi:MAG: DUF3300 domain-containing protein [Methyloligellaceae bacterium]